MFTMQIEMAPRSGDEILFEFMGTCESIEMTIEDGRLNLLFEEFTKENACDYIRMCLTNLSEWTSSEK